MCSPVAQVVSDETPTMAGGVGDGLGVGRGTMVAVGGVVAVAGAIGCGVCVGRAAAALRDGRSAARCAVDCPLDAFPYVTPCLPRVPFAGLEVVNVTGEQQGLFRREFDVDDAVQVARTAAVAPC